VVRQWFDSGSTVFDSFDSFDSQGSSTGHPAAGDAHYGVIAAEAVLYRAPLIRLFRHGPSDPDDPTFFLNTDMWDL